MMNSYLTRTLKIGENELNEMGDALESTISIVDWAGNRGRDILYNANPRFFGGGTYLYREDRTVNGHIPVYHPAIRLDGLKGRYCFPLITNDENGFNILMLEEEHLVLYRNTGTRNNPVFGECKEKILHIDTFLDTFIRKKTSLNSIHSFTRPGQTVTDIIIVCSADERKSYWPGGKSLWQDSEHPDGGFGRAMIKMDHGKEMN